MLSRQPRQADEEPRRNIRSTWIVAVLVIVFVLYPLSIGPMNVLVIRYGVSHRVFIAYLPLVRICEVTHTNTLLMNYRMWWFRVTGNEDVINDTPPKQQMTKQAPLNFRANP